VLKLHADLAGGLLLHARSPGIPNFFVARKKGTSILTEGPERPMGPAGACEANLLPAARVSIADCEHWPCVSPTDVKLAPGLRGDVAEYSTF
jgi:hypothetical protein